jgi:hypothetical protein
MGALPPALVDARNRLIYLIEEGTTVSRYSDDGTMHSIGEPKDNYLIGDTERFATWRVSAQQIIIRLVGDKSHYLRTFAENNNQLVLDVKHSIGVLRALLSDLDAGQLHDVQRIVRGEVFLDFLDQAKYLLSEGYHVAAAVLAGGVLEDALRKLCSNHSIDLPDNPKLNRMNDDLMKAGEYEVLVHKQITVWADAARAGCSSTTRSASMRRTSSRSRCPRTPATPCGPRAPGTRAADPSASGTRRTMRCATRS